MDFRAIAMGLAFSAMWSSAFTSARMIVMDAPPLTALTIRFLISGLIGIGIALLLGQNARLSRAQWRSVLIFGICQNALYLGFNFVAMTRVEAGLASIIASMMPLMVALLRRLSGGRHYHGITSVWRRGRCRCDPLSAGHGGAGGCHAQRAQRHVGGKSADDRGAADAGGIGRADVARAAV
jgi:hypothetical protein